MLGSNQLFPSPHYPVSTVPSKDSSTVDDDTLRVRLEKILHEKQKDENIQAAVAAQAEQTQRLQDWKYV
jgi:hypothetical protein